jgi:hypothetical protein
LERERVQVAPHLSLECGVNHLVLLNAAFALKGRGYDMGGVMIAVTCQVFDSDLGVGKSGLDKPLDIACIHRHREVLFGS